MTDLLSELDHGPSALPRGSEVTLFNTRSSQEVMGMCPSPNNPETLMRIVPIPDSPPQTLPWLCLMAFSCVWSICLFDKDM